LSYLWSVAWTHTLPLLVLSDYALQLPLLSQPPLPDLPTGGHPSLAGRATGVDAAGPILPGHLHPALLATHHRPPATGDDLPPAVSHIRRGTPTAGPRPPLPGWADWHARRPADLDPRLGYHPQVHYLVPALALTPAGTRWLVGNSDFLLHVKPLGELFRAKFRVGLRQTRWAGQVDAHTWAKSWVVDCRPVGSGVTALKYLVPYIFRIALSNNRIEQVANERARFATPRAKPVRRNGPRCLSTPSSGAFLRTYCRKGLSRFAPTDCSMRANDSCWRRCGVSWHSCRQRLANRVRSQPPNRL
jgi:Putative transposase